MLGYYFLRSLTSGPSQLTKNNYKCGKTASIAIRGRPMKTSSFLKLSSMALAIATISTGTYAAQLEEIIVTAQKRAESLQDVPISMTALSGEKISEAGMNSFADLAAYVPNLGISENAVATGIYMRGVGPGAQQSFEQSVGLYVDGVHMAKGRQVRTGMFDLAQV